MQVAQQRHILFMSAGVYKTKEVVNAIRLYFQNGNTTGTYSLYGVKEI